MKRIVLSAVAVAMLAVPTIQSAQAATITVPRANVSEPMAIDVQYKRHDDRRYDTRRFDDRRDFRKQEFKRGHTSKWKRGQKYGNWKQYRPVNDYHRYGLQRPPHGQQWIRVGNEYLLVGIATGLIFGLMAGR